MILHQKQIDQVVRLLQSRVPSFYGLYLFGSGATQSFTESSDVDLAITTREPLGNQLLWDLKFELAELLKREVDLIDLTEANTVLQMQVISTGERLFTSDYKASEWFDSSIYWNYITLNEDRAPILEEVAKNKTIYG